MRADDNCLLSPEEVADEGMFSSLPPAAEGGRKAMHLLYTQFDCKDGTPDRAVCNHFSPLVPQTWMAWIESLGLIPKEFAVSALSRVVTDQDYVWLNCMLLLALFLLPLFSMNSD
jgi:hypothetical protein